MWTFLVNSAFGVFICDDINYIAKFIMNEHDIDISLDDIVAQIKMLDEERYYNVKTTFFIRYTIGGGEVTVTKIEKRGNN